MVSESRRKAQGRLAIGGLVLGCGLTALVVTLGELYYAGNIAFVIGASAVFAVIVWTILKAAVGGAAPSSIKGWHLLVVLAAGIAPGLATLAHVKSQERIAAAAIRTVTTQALTPGAHIDTTTQATGLAGELEKFIRMRVAADADEQARYMAELKTIGVAQAMTATALTAPGGLDAAAAALGKAKAATEAHRTRYNALFEEAKAEVDAVNAPIEVKAQLYQGLDTQAGANKTAANRISDLDEQAFDEMAAEVHLLKTAKGRWAAQGGKLAFGDPDTLARFNQHGLKIQAIVAEEGRIQAENKARVQAVMDQMSAAVK